MNAAFSRPEALRVLLSEPGIAPMPCCFDALSARLIERAGFRLTLMSGFAVSATRLALPDTGLISFTEMVETLRDICVAAPSLLVIGDGDTGYGNALNVKRTVAAEDEMRGFCAAIARPCMANMVGGGVTPVLPLAKLEAIGYRLAAYPLEMLTAGIRAMQATLIALGPGSDADLPPRVSFAEFKDLVGFGL